MFSKQAAVLDGRRRDTGAIGRPIVPKEHGAWAVVYGAFMAGVGVAGRVNRPAVFLLGIVTLLVLANGPLTQILRPARHASAFTRFRSAQLWLLAYGGAAGVFLVPLLATYRLFFLLPFGAAGACLITLRALWVRKGRDTNLAGELLGVAGLALIGSAAHATIMGEVQPVAFVLWMLLFLFFASGVFYVRMRIRTMIAQRVAAGDTSRPTRRWCAVYHVLLLLLLPAMAAVNMIPWAVLLAFAPALWRAVAGARGGGAIASIRRLGWSEVALTGGFVLLLVASLSGY